LPHDAWRLDFRTIAQKCNRRQFKQEASCGLGMAAWQQESVLSLRQELRESIRGTGVTIPMAELTLQSIAFPVVDADQIAQLASCAAVTPKQYRNGATLIQVGRVLLLIHGDDLNKNMSSYLVRRIEETAKIEMLCNTPIRQLLGNGHLNAIEIENRKTGQLQNIETPTVFSFIGATPRTD
jgi:hypothetical protein